MNERIRYYSNRLPELEEKLKKAARSLGWMSVGRFTAFVAFVSLLVFHNRMNTLPLILLLLMVAMVFGMLIKQYLRLAERKKFIEKLVEIHHREMDILAYNLEGLDGGNEFSDPQHSYSWDLDVFGEGSLYAFLNRAVLKRGREKLAEWLLNRMPDTKKLEERQQAVKELAQKDTLRQEYMATGELFMDDTDNLKSIREWLSEAPVLSRSIVYRSARIIFPLLFLISSVLTVIRPDLYRLIILVFLVQLAIIGARIRSTNRMHELFSRHMQTFKKLSRLFALFEKESFESVFLSGLKHQFCSGGLSAGMAIKRLSRLLSAFDTRLNMLAGFLLNGIFLWDVQCVLRLEKWKMQYRTYFDDWVEGLSEVDALNSLATFHFNFPGYVFPAFGEETVIQATFMGHPLIPDEQRVCNDFSIPRKGVVIIITGANMAGKSTFLRTVGVNLILGMAGAPVCARQFSLDPADLFTSMRTSDSLQHHESYFYAELKRIKTVVDELSRGRKMLIILDEILKGTNSTDKHKGSVAVLEKILALGGTGIIATHDLGLAHMAQQHPEKVINRCFEIEISGAEVFFDYILREGVTQKMNASLLMRQMGIVGE